MMMLNSAEDCYCYLDAEVVLDSWTNCITYLAFVTGYIKQYSYVQQEFVAAKVLRKRTLSAFIGGNDEEQGQRLALIFGIITKWPCKYKKYIKIKKKLGYDTPHSPTHPPIYQKQKNPENRKSN